MLDIPSEMRHFFPMLIFLGTIILTVSIILAIAFYMRGINTKKAQVMSPTSNNNFEASSCYDVDCVLIDDDPLIIQIWEMRAEKSNKTLLCFENQNDFMKTMPKLSRKCLIFIDSNLKDEVKGEELSLKLYQAGFSEIYICTGYPIEQFKEMDWLKGVIGKEPPEWFFNSK